jgi:hypothetical protein
MGLRSIWNDRKSSVRSLDTNREMTGSMWHSSAKLSFCKLPRSGISRR